jgi:hypothetical protein
MVGVVSGQSLPICGCHYWQWLQLWCAGPLGPWHDDFPRVYYDKLCLAAVMEGEHGGAPSVHASVCSRCYVVHNNLFVIFIIFGTLYIVVDNY